MISEEKNAILEKIAKLMNMGKGDANENEAAAALKMAAKLMAKHRITETEIDLETDSLLKDELEFELRDQGRSNNGVKEWVISIGANLASTFDCKLVYNSFRETMTFLGTVSDVETVSYFAEIVIHHVEEGTYDVYPNDRNWKKRREVGNAAASVIAERLWDIKIEMDRHLQAGVSERGLVVKKDARVNEAYQEQFPDAKAKRLNTAVPNRKAMLAGEGIGKSAPLNRALNEGNQQSLT